MTTLTHDGVDHEAHDHDGHSHPTDGTYWKVGLFLAILTALEVVAAETLEGFAAGAALMIMMVIKFATVALMFMHLRFDHPMLRNLFLIGLFLALGVYAAAAGAMHFWGSKKVEDVIVDIPADVRMPPQPTVPAAIPHGGGGGH